MPEWAEQINFSTPYFALGQQFLAKKGVVKSVEQIEALRIGADKGTTNEINLRKLYPKTVIIAYDDTPFAFVALRNGNVQAITQDGPKLVGLLANVLDKENYEILPFTISDDFMGVGIPKGETALTDFANKALLELEENGTALKIYNSRFRPQSKTPLPRLYKITDVH